MCIRWSDVKCRTLTEVGTQVTARQLLSGNINPPHEADILIRVLSSRVFSGYSTGGNYDEMYNDIPQYDDRRDDFIWDGRNGPAYGEGGRGPGSPTSSPARRAATWNSASDKDDLYVDRNRADPSATFENMDDSRSVQFQRQHFNSTYSDNPSSPTTTSKKGPPPLRPTAPKPDFKPTPRASTLGANQAVALYTFEATQSGDLGFKKGDIITVTKRTDSKNDWWTGQIEGRTGIFPSNYVETI